MAVFLPARIRYKQRYKSGSTLTYAEACDDPTEQQVDSLRDTADVVIDTKRCTSQDVLTRVSCLLNPRQGKGLGYADVVVGGNYGSEGKGQIVAHLAPEYDILVRVGGPNAGHKVFEEPEPYTHHQLPSGTRRSQARLFLGGTDLLVQLRERKFKAKYLVDIKGLEGLNELSFDPIKGLSIGARDRN